MGAISPLSPLTGSDIALSTGHTLPCALIIEMRRIYAKLGYISGKRHQNRKNITVKVSPHFMTSHLLEQIALVKKPTGHQDNKERAIYGRKL